MIGGLGLTELIVIFGIALLVFGAARIPEIARSLGKAIKEFRQAGKDLTDESTESSQSKLGNKS
jgi:sec-independent protein translocase protein TatA